MSFQPLEMETLVAATLDQAWEAWTTDAGLRRFLADHTKVELRIGGCFLFWRGVWIFQECLQLIYLTLFRFS